MRRLTKSNTNQVVFGVMGGLGEYFDIDPVILRVAVVVLTFVGVGSTVPLYLLLALIMPDESAGHQNRNKTAKTHKQDWREAFKNQRDTRQKPPRKDAENAVEEDDWSDF